MKKFWVASTGVPARSGMHHDCATFIRFNKEHALRSVERWCARHMEWVEEWEWRVVREFETREDAEAFARWREGSRESLDKTGGC